MGKMQICTRCLYDESVPGITFDAVGVCSYCHLHDQMDATHPVGDAGWRHLIKLAAEIKRDRQGDYDCVVGVSGGCDSSLTLKTAVDLGLNPLAVHFDNTWNGARAVANIKAMCEGLGVDLWTYVVDNQEYDAISRAFLLAGVRDFEAPTDIALATVLYRAAERFNTRYIFNGHSFRTEGIAPLGWSYMDGRYIADVCRQHGGPRRFASFPNLWFGDFLRWSTMGFKRVRPLYWIDYRKEDVKNRLAELYGWQWYGGHHHENELTMFFMYYLLPRRFNIDLRKLGWSALIRSGQMSRREGLRRIEEPPAFEAWQLRSVLDRLEFTEERFAELMAQPLKTHLDYRTYKPWFEATCPLWWALMKAGRVPYSFYSKYALRQRRIPIGKTMMTVEWQAQ